MGAFLNRISNHFNGGIASGDFSYAKNDMTKNPHHFIEISIIQW